MDEERMGQGVTIIGFQDRMRYTTFAFFQQYFG